MDRLNDNFGLIVGRINPPLGRSGTMNSLGNIKQKFSALTRGWANPGQWRSQWQDMEPRHRLAFVVTSLMALFCLIVFVLLVGSCGNNNNVATNTLLGPANGYFNSVIAPMPPAKIEDVRERVQTSNTRRQKYVDSLVERSAELGNYISGVLGGKAPEVSWIDRTLKTQGMNREKFIGAYAGDRIRIARWNVNGDAPDFAGSNALKKVVESCFEPWAGVANVRVDAKLDTFRVIQDSIVADVSIHIFAKPDETSGRQATSLWEMKWDADSFKGELTLKDVTVSGQEEIVNYTPGGTLLQDCTGSVMKRVPFDQLFYGLDFWARRIPGLDINGEHGISVSDINRDGMDDVYVCQPHGMPNLLLVQQSDGTVESKGRQLGVDFLDESYASLLLNFDNDRTQDLVVSTDEGLVMMSQRSNGTFQLEHRLAIGKGARSLAAADYDQDGDLDILLCKYLPVQTGNYLFPRPDSFSNGESGGRNILLRNDEGWKFTDVTEEVGLGPDNHRYSRAAVWLDYDLDGDQDLYVANEFYRDQLYENRDFSFSDVGARVPDLIGTLRRSVSQGEFNGDGRPDLIAATAHSDLFRRELEENTASDVSTALQRLRGNSATDIPPALQVFRSACRYWEFAENPAAFGGYQMPSPVFTPGHTFSSAAGDLNNDGVDDLLLTSGGLSRLRNEDVSYVLYRDGLAGAVNDEGDLSTTEIRDSYRAVSDLCRKGYSFESNQRNRCFLSLGEPGFANISSCSGFDLTDDSRGVATTDWDGDGDLDVIVNSRGGPQLRFLCNQLTSANQTLTLELEGSNSNRDAIGARVEVYLDGRLIPIAKTLSAGSGSLCQSSKQLLFGLGRNPVIGKVVVVWPNGNSQTFFDVKPENAYRLVEGATEAAGINSNRFQNVAVQQSRPPGPEIRVTELFERNIFYPRVGLPVLQFQGEPDKYFDIEIYEQRALLVVFWTRDTESETLLKKVENTARKFSDAELDVLAIYVDSKSKSASSDWANASDSIQETRFPFRWGTAAQSTVQKMELLFGDWFAHQDISEMPFGLLLDEHRQVAAYYPSRQITFNRIHRDLSLLDMREQRFRDLAVPFPGTWMSPYRNPTYGRLISAFDRLGFKEDSRRLTVMEKPNSAMELAHRAFGLQSMGDIQTAKRCFEQAVKIHPECLTALIGDGRLIMSSLSMEANPDLRNKMLLNAGERFDAVIRIDPFNVEAILASADVSIARGKNEDAIAMLKKYIDSNPGKYEVHAKVGRELYQLGKYQEAASFLVTAYENRPTLPNVSGDLGYLYLKDDQFSHGLEYLRLARRLQPSETGIASALVEAEFLSGNYPQAIELARDVLTKSNKRKVRNILAWLLATCPYESRRDGNEAIEVIAPMLELYGESSAATLEIQAAALAEKGDFATASELQHKAVRLVSEELAEETYTERQIAGMNDRLVRYESSQPYRTTDWQEVPIKKPAFD